MSERQVQSASVGLPLPARPLIGRETELRTASRLLQTPGVRLLTLRGPGGIGKTRLAVELAQLLAPEFEGGSVWVGLAALSDALQVLPAIASALEVPTATPEAIAAHLTGRRILLVLDNAEHLPAAAPDLARLLAQAPGLSLLVTSRAALNLQGERELPVGPLSLPSAQRTAEQSGAVQLFLECARAIDPQLNLDAQTRPRIEQLCVRLEGVPLALELAAARLRAVSLEGLLGWLDHPLEVLTGGPSDGPHHGSSLRGTIRWSYDLLDPPLQAVFRACSVFVNGFTLPALDAVAGHAGVRDAIIRLAEHSLLQPVSGSPEPRWKLLEPVREFGREQLAADPEADMLHERHAAYYLALAEQVVKVGDEAPLEWHASMTAEDANLQAALAWWVEHQQTAQAMRLILALGYHWGGEAPLLQLGWLERSAALPDAAAHPALLAAVLSDLGQCSMNVRRFGPARPALEAALRLYRELNDREGEVCTHLSYAGLLSSVGEYAEARRLYDQLEAHFDEHPHDLTRMAVINNTGVAWLRQNRPGEALGDFERAYQFSVQENYDLGIAFGLTMRHWASYLLGRGQEALPLASEAWKRTLRLHYPLLRYTLPHQLAFEARDAGRLTLAAQLVGCSEAMRARTNAPWDDCIAPHVQQLDNALQADLGEAYARERAIGGTLSLDNLTPQVLAWLDEPSTTRPAPAPGLTARELEVLRLLSQGLSDKRISQLLKISSTTVSKHVSNMLGKQGFHNRVELARWATLNHLPG
ncbi:helix-turn-helix transcriptional regulator [Deinococcus sonorensis]|uniref:LuxR C-terminal-related transcriptional regulator n=2 Tax=Deinococcus sonorensis TaxID=309891 RepID=A0AAU7U4J2_9DEIO